MEDGELISLNTQTELYEVKAIRLREQVKRNNYSQAGKKRVPEKFNWLYQINKIKEIL